MTGGGTSGPARVWKHVDGVGKMGVAVARSVGDHALAEFGITAEPSVTQRALEQNDKCLLLGSDGLWDMVSNEKAVSVAQKYYPDATQAAAALIKMATRRWRKAEARAVPAPRASRSERRAASARPRLRREWRRRAAGRSDAVDTAGHLNRRCALA